MIGDRGVEFEPPMTRATPPPERQPATVNVRLVASLIVLVLGLALAVAGAATLWGPGAALFTAGVPLVAVGVLLGLGT
jgi:hypothetical protein